MVHGHGIDHQEILFQQIPQGEPRRIVLYPHGFRVARVIMLHLLIGGVGGGAVGVAYLRFQHAGHQIKVFLAAPEAAAGQINGFFHSFQSFHISFQGPGEALQTRLIIR